MIHSRRWKTGAWNSWTFKFSFLRKGKKDSGDFSLESTAIFPCLLQITTPIKQINSITYYKVVCCTKYSAWPLTHGPVKKEKLPDTWNGPSPFTRHLVVAVFCADVIMDVVTPTAALLNNIQVYNIQHVRPFLIDGHCEWKAITRFNPPPSTVSKSDCISIYFRNWKRASKLLTIANRNDKFSIESPLQGRRNEGKCLSKGVE